MVCDKEGWYVKIRVGYVGTYSLCIIPQNNKEK
jgi:hypothetical protein